MACEHCGIDKEAAANDYRDMRKFQERFMKAERELRGLKESVQHFAETIYHDPYPTVEAGKFQAGLILDLLGVTK